MSPVKLPPGTLPPDAQRILKDAAAAGSPGTFTRQKAIDRAIERVRSEYPDYFTKEIKP